MLVNDMKTKMDLNWVLMAIQRPLVAAFLAH